ncbi:MAG: hypothetical protein ACR2NO_10250, partial [Chloroflexota bacterium]
MNLEAFVLPLPGRSLAVIFWDRVRRAAGDSALSVYAPGELSPGELSEIASSLVASLGDATAEAQQGGPAPALLICWWLGGSAAAVALALHAFTLGAAFAWLALATVGLTLPWSRTGNAFGAARRASAARKVTRRLVGLEPAPGIDPSARERISAVWQFARAQRGSETDQMRALERFCDEQAWPAAASVYQTRLALADGRRRWRFGRRMHRRQRLFSL